MGNPLCAGLSPSHVGAEIRAEKTTGTDVLVMNFRLVDVGFEGDVFPSDQDFADILGVLVDALDNDGFSVQVTETGGVSRSLDEVP